MTSYFKHKMRRKSPGEIAGWIVFGTFAIVGLAILFGFIIMWLWNWLMPTLFGLTAITYWQAVGLFILAKILIGGCGGHKSGKVHRRYKDRYRERCREDSKGEFYKWRYYDKFWNEVGEKVYKEFVERMNEKFNEGEFEDKTDGKPRGN